MNPANASLAYRRAATEQASVVGLVIALYDTLSGDLKRAAAAMHRGDIPTRCAQLKHGFAVLTQLDNLLDAEHGGPTAQHLRRFYEHLRKEMLRAQFALDAQILARASSLILDVREAWQQVDMRADTPTPSHVTYTATEASSHPAPHTSLSCQA